MPAALKVLNDICYILEALAQDLTGESKSELSQLRKNLLENPDYELIGKERIANIISAAREDIREYRKIDCGIKLSGICRELWAIVEGR